MSFFSALFTVSSLYSTQRQEGILKVDIDHIYVHLIPLYAARMM